MNSPSTTNSLFDEELGDDDESGIDEKLGDDDKFNGAPSSKRCPSGERTLNFWICSQRYPSSKPLNFEKSKGALQVDDYKLTV